MTLSSRPKRKPREIKNPMMLIAGKQPIGTDSDKVISPLLAHWYEVKRGRGYDTSIRVVTLFLSAANDAAVYYKNLGLQQASDAAGDEWIKAGEASKAKGIEGRIVLHAGAIKAIDRLVVAMVEVMPFVEVAAWACFMLNARERWTKFSKSGCFSTK